MTHLTSIIANKLVRFPDPSRGGERKGLVNYLQLAWIYDCILAVSIVKGKNATQANQISNYTKSNKIFVVRSSFFKVQ